MTRCIGVDGAGHTAQGHRCGALIESPARRCPACAPAHETTRTRERRTRRPYTAEERDRRRAAVDAWVAEHGTLCPGWLRAEHLVAREELTAEHPVAVAAGGSEQQELDVLCRSCNASKGMRSNPIDADGPTPRGQCPF